MNADFVVWTQKAEPKACTLLGMENFDEGFKLRRGDPLLAEWPIDVTFRMHPEFPDDHMLVDAVMNVSSAIIASPRLAALIVEFAAPDVELLPIRILDHKGKLASADYVVIHPVNAVDAVDRGQSVFDLVFNSRLFDTFSSLVLDAARVPSSRQIFRLMDVWSLVLLRGSLADKLDQRGVNGVRWKPVADYSDDN